MEEDTFHLDLSVPLFIRCMEWAREDAKSDIIIHKFVERMINVQNNKKDSVLDSDDYEKFINEEVPTNNISSGAVVNPQNRPLGIGAKIKKGSTQTSSMFKRWKDAVDNV